MRAIERQALRLLATADAVSNRLYESRFNPLYQSGTILIALYLTLLVTGLWLILFYRVAAPWESVAALTGNLWAGNWVRGLHRYASDAAVVATGVHAFRMFAQGRSWGARTLAWVSGGVLFLLLLLCGWTGYVMVWDTFGEQLAREIARMLDALPVLSEPSSRAFTGERAVPSGFFFITMFAHIGIPLGMGVVFWLHVKRLSRPAILPPRPLMYTVIGLLAAVAVVWPLAIAPKADPFTLPVVVPADVFFAFWIPFTRGLGGGTALTGLAAGALALLVLPIATARRGTAAPAPSFVDETLCTGCVQCSIDCPYGAIEMIARANRPAELVARVDPALCVSCGLCAGSCAPMGVGPAGRTGRDQIARVQAFLASTSRRPGEIVVISCDHGAGMHAPALAAAGAAVYPVDCAGSLHTSVIELLLRGGAGGVLVLACPPRDCWHREGPRWLVERVYHEREAELQARVDRARVRVAHVSAGERRLALAALRGFAAEVSRLEPPRVGRAKNVEPVCDRLEPAGRT